MNDINVTNNSLSYEEEWEKQQSIFDSGYELPDADGSRSSVIRKEAVLNNSFNEEAVRETLKSIYLNSTDRLASSNNANVHFFHWYGSMKDMDKIPSTDYCEFKIPTESFVSAKQRDIFKRSEFYGKWITVDQILNNWDVFQWHCMLFVNQRIYSDYELRIDDTETMIRFRYKSDWLFNNYPIYIYKFDTNASCRIKITRELVDNQWDWKMPVEYITDKRVLNSNRIMVAFNKISDNRSDGSIDTDVIGDNIEILSIENGYVDLSTVSKFNRFYILSEREEWLWMSIIVPKFFHEFPIILPTDIIYQPFKSNNKQLYIYNDKQYDPIKVDVDENNNRKNVYAAIKDIDNDIGDVWKRMIRPVVLADAYDSTNETTNVNVEEVSELRNYTIKAADDIETLRLVLSDPDSTDDNFNAILNNIIQSVDNVRDSYNTFLDNRGVPRDQEFETIYNQYHSMVEEIKKDGKKSVWFSSYLSSDRNFFKYVSPLLTLAREFADQYNILITVDNINTRRVNNKWDDTNIWKDTVRFQRPIDVNDFWTFEYDMTTDSWRPYPLEISYHFPDVYIMNDTDKTKPLSNRIFKTFFFYSDTMNVVQEYRELDHSTPDWDNTVDEYYDKQAIYRDIFMEKFYWMGIRSIYKGLMRTQCRWEAIEFIIDNPAYERFNKLFLQTIAPYFKVGMNEYISGNHYGFPFDDAIDNINKAINAKTLGYQNVVNFENYLNNSWIPSYFDNTLKLSEGWNYSEYLVRRPRATFDINRVLPILTNIQDDTANVLKDLLDDISWIVSEYDNKSYNVNIDDVKRLNVLASQLQSDIDVIKKMIKDLDMQIYSIDDINAISNQMKSHIEIVEEINKVCENIGDDSATERIQFKLETLNKAVGIVNDTIDLYHILNKIPVLDIDAVKKLIDPEDNSVGLVGYFNLFKSPWPQDLKDIRNNLVDKVHQLIIMFTNNDSCDADVYLSIVREVSENLLSLRNGVLLFWRNNNDFKEDQILMDYIDNACGIFDSYIQSVNTYNSEIETLNRAISGAELEADKISNDILSNEELENRKLSHDAFLRVIECLENYTNKNIQSEAPKKFDEAKFYYYRWITYCTDEMEFFNRYIKITKKPIEFVETLNSKNYMMEAMIEYLETVNILYHPDLELPTYSDIYTAKEVEIISGGFQNNIGDTVYIPKVGVYTITDIDAVTEKATAVRANGYRQTTFRNPTVQTTPYDTITDGDGFGITAQVKSISRKEIVNDEIVNSLMILLENMCYLINKNAQNWNPSANMELNSIIKNTLAIKDNWNVIKTKYSEYISQTTISSVDNLISKMDNLIKSCNKYIDQRGNISFEYMLGLLNTYIHETHNYLSSVLNDMSDVDKYYDVLAERYTDLYAFHTNAPSWSNEDAFYGILYSSKDALYNYYTNAFKELYATEELRKYERMYNELVDVIDDIISGLELLPITVVDINSLAEDIKHTISLIRANMHKDSWYKIDSVSIADGGENFIVGDIVKIIPQLPKDLNGEDIHDNEELIMNDNLFIQITAVENGKVVKAQALMNYALPYQLNGIRDTETVVGHGSGLLVRISSSELQLFDSTIFNENSSATKTNQFDENDLFAFPFANNYELDTHYDIFAGGVPKTDFYYRHENGTDIIYVNVNDVNNLKDSYVSTDLENYYIYKLDNVVIKDPGAGYSINQIIYVAANGVTLKLRVTKLTDDLTGGIAEVELINDQIQYSGTDLSIVNATAIPDNLNNIDDEFNSSEYDKLPVEGLRKAATFSHDPLTYSFIAKRHDKVDGDRNKFYMGIKGLHHELNGDPDYGYYVGSHPHNINDGIKNTISPIDGIISDDKAYPTNKPSSGDYQMISRCSIHSIPNNKQKYDYTVDTHDSLPRGTVDWPEGEINKYILVQNDESNDGHMMLYRIRSFTNKGYFVYDDPEVYDEKWNSFNIRWKDLNWKADYPDKKSRFYSDGSDDKATYQDIMASIIDDNIADKFPIHQERKSRYISNLVVDDISVYNHTTNTWENLNDNSRWKLTVNKDPSDINFGFTLEFIDETEEDYSYDMSLYLNKIPSVQMKNASLVRNAIFDIDAVIVDEVNHNKIQAPVDTGKEFRVRKMIGYHLCDKFVLDGNNEMMFHLKDYKHFRNEIHLEDITIYNRTYERFEDVLDTTKFEVCLKDPRMSNRGLETHTIIKQALINNAGENFSNGEVWCWNDEYKIQLIGRVTADIKGDGHLITFEPVSCPNPPDEDLQLEFMVYQQLSASNDQSSMRLNKGSVMVEFINETIEMHDDGYIHNVTNRLAPLTNDVKIINKQSFGIPVEYEIIIDKTCRQWTFVDSRYVMSPVVHIDGYIIPSDRIYVLTEKGRLPLVNPATGKPTLNVTHTATGTDVTILTLYKKYEKFTICEIPYPMRSVFVQRQVPNSGYIDLAGKLNKPLNRKYHEFWMNGKLLSDEVSIISPTKLFLHGTKSLRNFEIIEINRDSNEYFANNFLEIQHNTFGDPVRFWNYRTYLDDALEGTLEGDNYSLIEQEYLLTPVWKQVDVDHPEFKNYPPNMNIEDDVIMRINPDDYPITDIDSPNYQFMLTNIPKIEGCMVNGSSIDFDNFNLIEIDDETVIDMMNEEWKDEIKNDKLFPVIAIIKSEEWYGMLAKLYDANGNPVDNISDADYYIPDDSLLLINSDTKLSRIMSRPVLYDLT